MTDPMPISGPAIAPTSGETRSLVVFLHGWGAGDDLIAIGHAWRGALPDTRFVAPHAPDVCDENPLGRQWFGFGDRDPSALAKGAARAAAVIDRFLDDTLAAFGLGDDRLALVGFSQGAMMAIYVALRRARACAGVISYSGALIGGESLVEAQSVTPTRIVTPPMLLVHGDADPVVPPRSMPAAVDLLTAIGVPARSHLAKGVGHGIDEESIALGRDFLVEALAD